MLIAIFGENCTGKSTLAGRLKEELDAEIYTGKDYLRLAKDEVSAQKLFRERLREAVAGNSLIYVISEKEHLSLYRRSRSALPRGCTASCRRRWRRCWSGSTAALTPSPAAST